MHQDPLWLLPPRHPILGGEMIHIWRAALDTSPERVAALRETLAADERARAEQFRFPLDSSRSIVARGLLRAILARYLDREPGAIAFQYGPAGKPSLHDADSDDISFNVSHADGVGLYAITRGRAIGVDIERVRADMANDGVAARFFSPREVASLRALQPELRSEAFFTCWTRKEAYVKARGVGVTAGLDQFDVSLAPDEPAALLANREESEAQRRWSLYHLAPGPGYVGAVAVEGENHALACWQWREPCACSETDT